MLQICKGAHNAIQIHIVDYESKASCVYLPRTLALVEPCAQSLEEMPASRRSFSFVGPDDPHPDKYARLPRRFVYGERITPCYLLSLPLDAGFRSNSVIQPSSMKFGKGPRV